MKWQDLARILFMDDLYRRIVDVPGVILELGVRWGQNLALFSALRTIYEPFNHNRKVIGFDTFAGFPSPHAKDGTDDIMREGSSASRKATPTTWTPSSTTTSVRARAPTSQSTS